MHRETLTARSVDTTRAVGVLGATSFLGRRLLERLQAPDPPGAETSAAGRRLFAFTRAAAATPDASGRVRWRRFPIDHATWRETIPHWVAVCPLWAVPEHFPLLEASGARRLVALSSTSRFTKRESTDAAERSLAARLAAAEDEVIAAARARGIVATIFRPTMIYDGSHDRNVTAIAAFIRRYRFFPVVGAAAGLRQPVHADDVVAACETALARDGETDAYELSGGEILSYREMVRRIFLWLGRPPRLLTVPVPLVRPLGIVPVVGSLSAKAVRMNDDLVFDHAPAARDFGFAPRPFVLPLSRAAMHARR